MPFLAPRSLQVVPSSPAAGRTLTLAEGASAEARRFLPERPPKVGELVQVRSRRWLVENVIEAGVPGQSPRVQLTCADDDAQGQAREVFWDCERDRLILEQESWGELAAKGFASPRHFAAFLAQVREPARHFES